jgi:hypothetical protein
MAGRPGPPEGMQVDRRPTRRRFVLGAGTVGLGLVAGCGRLPGQVAAGAQGPVPVPPGAVPLIRDEADTPGLPRHFRTTTDPFPADAPAPLPSRAGLDNLRASGSAQFTVAQLQAIVERVGHPLVVIDLRQESHGFLDGQAVSWYAMHDQVNVVRSLVEVQQSERRRLEALTGPDPVTALVITARSDSGTIQDADAIALGAHAALTEQQLARSLGLGYFRIPATDFVPPTPENVDRFVAFAAGLPPETWLHFHCHGGDGRTTTFLAMWDMMHNAGRVSADDIVRRHALIGPENLDHVGTPESWTHPFRLERAAFIRRFHEYAREYAPSGFVVPWSAWSASRPS